MYTSLYILECWNTHKKLVGLPNTNNMHIFIANANALPIFMAELRKVEASLCNLGHRPIKELVDTKYLLPTACGI
jgi:hypothetical protein